MAKGPKSTKEDDLASKASSATPDESAQETPCGGYPEEFVKEVEIADTKSVAESDTGKLCGDVLSNAMTQSGVNSEYNEPSLNDVIVQSYEGGKSKTGHFDGYGEALFVGGNKYAGLFLGGVMHGKGKYTWVDGSIYDGDMNNNQISGYGRYEWPDESYYEGEVSNGMRHGVGVFKSPKHDVSFSGQWYLGKRHGRGIMHYSNHSWYEGDWVNNARHGWGVRRYHTGNVYEGQWVNDKRHGEGTMRWLTADESYNGMWENGVQHGLGTHTWYLNRVPGSQYPIRNEYVGDFVNGLRHGRGKFFFASGAVYDGEWENNKKHGWGKFIFKNGKMFEGQFENDHMANYPNFQLDGSADFEGSTTRMKTPVGWEDVDKEETLKNRGNVLGPSFNLDIDSILDDFPKDQRKTELNQVTSLVLRNLSILRRVYSFYSALGHDKSPDNTFVMTRFQFWRFLKDCQIHHHNISLSQMDRSMARCHDDLDIHNPMEKLLLREFLTTCVGLSYLIFKAKEKSNDNSAARKSGLLCRCVERLIDEHIMKHSCRVGGHFLSEPRHAVCALAYMDRSWHIYQSVCVPRKEPPYEQSLTMRQFLFLLKDLKIIGSHFNTRSVLKILSSDDPSVSDGDFCNMEIEMTFLEFFEALIGIAVDYVGDVATQSSFVNEIQEPRLSRPSSSVTRTVSEVFPVQQDPSVEILTQNDEDRCGEDASKHSVASNPGENAAGFLHTLSQFSIQDDLTTVPEEPSIVPQDSQPNFGETDVETNPEEEEFNFWSSKLESFFMQLLFPAWNHQENVRAQVLKDRADAEEQRRLQELEKEAERRRGLISEEIHPSPPEEEAPPPESKDLKDECGSAGPEFQVVGVISSDLQTRPSTSSTSMNTTKSAKTKKRR